MQTPSAAPAALDTRLTSIAFWVLLAAGVALRIVLLFTSVWQLDSDNAVVYLVSKHISEGDIAWFFWGQNYGGTALEFVAGLGMLVFGPHVEVLGMTSILLFASVVVLVRYIGRAAFDARTGNIAAILFWFCGFSAIHVSISDPGFYGPSLLFGLGSAAVALRAQWKLPLLQWAAAGLLAGLALWQSPMAFVLALPALVILLIRQPSWRRVLIGVAGFVVGALPFIIITISPSIESPNRFGGWGTAIRNLGAFFTVVLPSTMSIDGESLGILVGLVCVGLLAVLAVVAVRHRNAWAGVLVAGSLLVVAVVSLEAGVALSASDFRYTVFVVPTLAIAAGWLLTRIRFLGLAAAVLATVLTLAQIATLFPSIRFTTTDHYILGDVRALGDYLEEQHISAALGDYWLSYAVTAETQERVTVGALSVNRRYAPYEIAAVSSIPPVIIVFAGADNDKALMQNAQNFPAYKRVEVAGYAVYTFDEPIAPFAYDWQLY